MKQSRLSLRGAIHPLLVVCAVVAVAFFAWNWLHQPKGPTFEAKSSSGDKAAVPALLADSGEKKPAQSPAGGGQGTIEPDPSPQSAGPPPQPGAVPQPPNQSVQQAAGGKPEPIKEITQKQIEALLAEKAARTPALMKMDSALIYLIKQARGEKIADVPTLQLDVQPDAQGFVEVDMTGTVSPDLLAAIKSGGGEVLNQVASAKAIRARLPVAAMEPLAARADVKGIRIADKSTTNLGSTVTEGDRTHRADTARTTFGATGAGIKVGVMSNGVDSLATSIASGNLNAGTVVLPGQAGSGDEGTAMLEIVQDLVPDAQLYFATANPTTAQFAQNIRDLAAAGCSVIVDDVGYFVESPFQDGPISQAVNDVSAAGVMYFSSAGNSGSVDKGSAGTWEGDFADGGTTALGSKAGSVHSFGGGLTYNTVISGGSSRRVDLFWADPLGASTNDYDVFVTDSTGAVLRSSTTTQNGTQDPYESLRTLNVGERIVIVKTSAAAARFLHLGTGRAVVSIATPGNVRGHNSAVAANAFCVAATSVVNSPSPAVFAGGATNPAETFSSDGPRRMFFNADGTAITPGNFSSTGGQVFQKPDITAADAVSTSVVGFTSFSGTSAAAPHAAAIAALLRSSNPALTPAQIRSALAATALDIEGAGFDRDTGSGIVMAYPAMQAVSTPSIASFSPGSGLPNTSVIIDGVGFFNATSVSFNGVSAMFTVNSPSQITATVPVGATTGLITVVGPLGTATSPTQFTVFGFSPTIGAPGSNVVLTGNGFTGATAVSFNGTSASYTVNSDTQITAIVPVGATTGPISVTAPGGPITSSTSFTALSGDGTPTIASFTPATGAVGSTVTLTGTNYVNVTNVAFNGVDATSFTVDSQTQITATVPVPSGSVTGSITVTTGYGTGSSSSAFSTLATLVAYNSMTEVPLTGNGFTASGAIYVSLSFAPVTGTNLTLVNNTGLSFISGAYSNLSQGQVLTLNYNGVAYNFAVNYYGGTGNDLVLQWANNRPVAWGLNSSSQLGNNNSTNVVLPTAVTTSGVLAGKTISQVAAGGSHTLALCTDGTLVAWGANANGQLGNNSTLTASEPVVVSTSGTALAGKTVTAIAAGASHSLALCSDGTVAAWGYNLNGQLGNNSTTQSMLPVAVSTSGTALSGKTVTAIAAGSSHSMARCSDGTLAAWGNNTNGQLGNNSTTQSTLPVAVTTTGTALAGKTVTAIALGSSHSVALCSDGSVAAWGQNSSGQVGDSSSSQRLVAVSVSTSGVLAGKTVSAISTVEGASHNLALCSDGTLVAWGLNTNGQLGVGSSGNVFVAPVTVSTTGTALAGKTVTGIFAGGTHSLVLCSDGSAAAWGLNTYGQLGNDGTTQSTTATAVATPGTPLSGKAIASLSGGAYHSLALCSDGSVAAWGLNSSGQLGNSTVYALAPVAVSSAGSAIAGKTLFAQSTGSIHSLALCSDGTVASWGFNTNGQLGNGTTVSSYVPAAVTMTGVLAGKTVVALAAGSTHSLALCSDGTVAAWGYNAYGQLGNNSTSQSTVPVAVTTTGTALAGKTVVAIAAGSVHSLALCSDGTLAAWGYNFNGQLGNNSTTQSNVAVPVTMSGVLSGKTVKAIAVGGWHNLVLCSDGTVAVWGNDGNGELGNNSNTDSSVPVLVSTSGVLSGKTVTAVSAGSNHSLVLCSDGSLSAWGLGSFGQLGNNSATNSNVPVAVVTSGVLSGKVVTAIGCGYKHNVVLCSDGTAAAWGYAGDGELGNNSQVQSMVPVLVSSAYLASGEGLVQAVSGATSYHSLGIVAGPPAAQILVQQPAGMNLSNGDSAVDFGSCLPGASTTRTFTLVNNGTAPLTLSGVTLDGANGSDFAVTTPPASTVAVGGSTSFVVTFTPGAALSRSGVLRISSNDPVNGNFAVNVAGAGGGTLAAVYNTAANVPISATSFTATGSTVNFTLNCALTTGASLMVVRNTGLNLINGNFDNLVQGQTVTMPFNGLIYSFVANYYGGTGNDLVLQWAGSRPVAWGRNAYSQLGNNNSTNYPIPTGITTTGVLAGKSVSKVASGGTHTLVLCSDGTLVAWGSNSSGQLGNGTTVQSTVPALVTMTGALSGKNVTAIAAGSTHCLALCTDGTLVAWGSNFYGQLGNNSTINSSVPVAVTTSGTALAGKSILGIYAGGNHSVALCSDSTITTWGYNLYGQLGNNSTNDSKVPVAVIASGALSGKIVSAVAAGNNHNLALCTDGTAVSWGSSSSGQLGNGTTTNSSVPVALTMTGTGLAGKFITAIAAGGYHSMALCSDGTVTAWGYNFYGQLGNNSTSSVSLAVAVGSYGSLVGKTVAGITAGFYHSLVRCSDGTMSAWGSNNYRQLGSNSTAAQSSVPVLVTTAGTPLAGKTLSFISAGQYHNFAFCTDNTLAGWGNGFNGQLGNNPPQYSLTPVATTSDGTPLSGQTVLAEAAGQYHSLALSSDGTLTAWGSNAFGQLGNGSTSNSLVPTAVSQFGLLLSKTVIAISAGQNHSLALCSDGTVAAWGYNFYGQLGNNSTTQSTSPVAVSTTGALAGKKVIAISAGQYHSLALCSDGTVAAWGYNLYGQLGNNSTTQSTTPVAVFTSGALAGKTVVSLSAGQRHNLVLCSDGSVISWGYNYNGQLGNGSTTQSNVPVVVNSDGTPLAGRTVIALAAGGSHSLALCSDGTAASWGYNFYGQLGNNSSTQSTVPVAVTTSGTALAGKTLSAIAVGYYHSAALCTDGTLAAWGYDAEGELGNNSTTNSPVPVAVSTDDLAAGEVYAQVVSGQSAYHSLALVASPLQPQFAVQQPVGVSLTSRSSTVDFGSSPAGTGTTQTFTLLNTGAAPLSLSSVTIDGANAADFAVTTAPDSSIAAGGSSTMTVTFTPGAGLGRSAALHFICNDPANSPFDVTLSGFGTVTLTANYSSAAVVPFTAASFQAAGSTVNLNLSYAPAPGTVLTVVKNTGVGFISGNLTNLAQGQNVALSYGGKTYQFVANYYGGTGNDLVLQWAGNRPLAWGLNSYGQLGNNAVTSFPEPVAVSTDGVLAGKSVVSIASGQYHMVALCSDGTLAAWGNNSSGQLGNNGTTQSMAPVAVSTSGVLAGRTVTAVSAGYYHVLALCSDGTVVGWGANSNGQLGNNSTATAYVPVDITNSGVLAGKTVIAISAGGYHNVALCSDGTVATWGYNYYGQLGNNSTTQSTVPVDVTNSGTLAGKTVIAISAGQYHCLAACSDGTANTWGYNINGQLGNSSTTNSSVPVAVTATGVLAGRTVKAVASGLYHNLVLCSDGTLAAWGQNGYGQLGNNSTTQSTVPVAVTTAGTVLGGRAVTAVSAGSYHCLALCSDGTAAAWGYNNLGQLGNASYANSSLPFRVGASGALAGKTVTALAGGGSQSAAVCSDGTVAAWGNNFYGQLGNDAPPVPAVPMPVATTGTPLSGKTVIAQAAGYGHSLSLCSDGTLAAWGYNNYGQLGGNSTTNSNIPLAVTTTGVLAGKTVIAVSAGYYHSMALCSDGTVATWGYNNYGQLGNNSTTQSSVPVAVTTTGALAGKTVVAISAGYYHSMALCSDGTVVTWGYNIFGQLGNNSITQSTVPVAVSTTGVLAGKTVTAVSAGYYHSVALCSDGTLAAWGYNSSGQLGNNSTTQSTVPVAVTTSGVLAGKTVTSVSAGYSHALALCSDGTMAAWGFNVYGQLGNNTTTNSTVPVAVTTSGVLAGTTVIALSAAYYHSVALCSDGTVAAWGNNADGELGNNNFSSSSVPVVVNMSSLTMGEQFVQASAGSCASHTLAIVAEPLPAPSLFVQQSAGANLISGSGSVDFGGVNLGASVTQTFTVGNAGTVDLLISGVTIDGVNAADFAITTMPATTVTSGSSTSVVVTFAPGGALGRSAALHLVSNDPYVSPFNISLSGTGATTIAATYHSAADVPLTTGQINFSGSTVNFTLSYAPVPGTTLTVVNNAGLNFINGAFSNLSQGQTVGLSYNGVTYPFVASYYGGTGNDLVLMWAGNRPVAWGYNVAGELGNNSLTASGIPVAVTTTGTPLANRAVLALSSGYQHSLALCSDGTLASWGYNFYGQLGNNTTTDSSVAVAVTTADTPLAGKVVSAVSAGYAHNLALCTDGTLAGWGYNIYGQLGDNTTTTSSVPVAVATAGTPLAGKSVVAINTGAYHSLALCSDGTLAAWGYNFYGQLGNNTTIKNSVPGAVTTSGTPLAGKSIVSVAAGAYHNLVLCSDGTLVTWGYNTYGQLGNNTTTNSSVPVAVTTAGTALAGKTIIAIAAGRYHSMALCSDGTLAAWGQNIYGQLGNNSTTQSNVPVAVITAGTALAGKTVLSLTAGYYYSVAACSDGTIATWGYNSNGQLGNDSTTQSSVPVAVSTSPLAAGENFMLAACGQSAYHTLSLVAMPVPPAATTLAATSVTGTTAVLNGAVNANGGSAAVSFDYGLDTTYGTNVSGAPATVSGSTSSAVSLALTGLAPATTYHFRVNGADSSGTANGADMTFTTPDTNANLSSLALSVGMFSPAFDSSVLAYSVAVPNATTSFAITAATSRSAATMTVNGTALASGVSSAPVAFSTDSTTVNVVVTAPDGSTSKIYMLNISRNTPYLDWAASNNLTGASNTFTGDSDGDGIPNLLEYAFNSNPASADKSILPTLANVLNSADSKHYFTFTYRRFIVPGSMTYVIESSSNLGSWSAVAAQNLQQVGSATATGDGVTEVVTFRLLPALEDVPVAHFVRLKVTP